MANPHFSFNNTSADLEKVALNRFRSLLSCIPQDCQIIREVWGASTALCLDFASCPDDLPTVRKQSLLLLLVADYLGLANSIIFRVDKKVIGWTNMMASCKWAS